MNTATQTAVEYAKRGWHVFPIQPGKKVPYQGFNWREKSTNDPVIIEKAAAHPDYKDCNWALDCGKSEVFVVDVDINKTDPKTGKVIDGRDSLLQYPDIQQTYVVETPSGGRHIYLKGKGKNSASKMLGPGLDTRGEGGYVLIPGSSNGTGRPYRLKAAGPLQPIPEEISAKFIKSEKHPQRDTPLVQPDKGSNIDRATHYLQHVAPEAVEGQGGDQLTYQIACHVRDLGVSEEVAFDLMWEHWNLDKAFPSWTPDELRKKVRNAYSYAQNPLGIATPEVMFRPEAAHPTERMRDSGFMGDEYLERQNWLMGKRYIPGAVTLTIAPGGVGKSLLTILEALSLVTGKKLTYNEPYERGNAWIINTEDTSQEIFRRITAASRHHGISVEERRGLFFSSYKEMPLNMVAYEDRTKAPIFNQQLIDYMSWAVEANNVKLLVTDPFVRTHKISENDNRAVDMVAQAFQLIAERTGCAVSLSHHANKGVRDGAGNADKSRGASSLISAVRVAHTLYPMVDKEGSTYGVPPELIPWLIRLDNAKRNLSRPGEITEWYKLISIILFGPMGKRPAEDTGTMEMYQLDKVELLDNTDSAEGKQILHMVLNSFDGLGVHTIHSLAKAIEESGRTSWASKKIGRYIKKWFTFPLSKDGYTYQLVVIPGTKGREAQAIQKTEGEL